MNAASKIGSSIRQVHTQTHSQAPSTRPSQPTARPSQPTNSRQSPTLGNPKPAAQAMEMHAPLARPPGNGTDALFDKKMSKDLEKLFKSIEKMFGKDTFKLPPLKLPPTTKPPSTGGTPPTSGQPTPPSHGGKDGWDTSHRFPFPGFPGYGHGHGAKSSSWDGGVSMHAPIARPPPGGGDL